MRSKLASLGRIQTPFEQSAENGWVNVGPIQLSGFQQLFNVGLFQRQGRAVIEQPTVKPIDLFQANLADILGGHCGEQQFRVFLKLFWC